MTYIKKTFQYLSKSFWLLALIALAPAVVFGIFSRPLGFITFLPDYSKTFVNGYGDIAWLVFDKYTLTFVYPMILMFVLAVIAVSLSLSVIEKHFRMGRLMLKAPLKDLNSSLFPVLKTAAVVTALYFVWKFLLTGLTTLLHYIISGGGVPSMLNVILLGVIIAILFFILLYFALPAIFLAPLMLIFGYSFSDAFIEAFKLSSKATFKLFIALAVPLLAIMLLQFVVEFLPINVIVEKVIATVLYTFMIVYLCALMMVATFDLVGMERRDIKKRYV